MIQYNPSEYNPLSVSIDPLVADLIGPYEVYDLTRKQQQGIAPHQHKELSLMLNGWKPVAMNPVLPETFDPYVGNNLIGKKLHKIGKTNFTFFYLCDQFYRVEDLISIYQSQSNTFTIETHMRIGKLLGYSDAEIHSFLTKIA